MDARTFSPGTTAAASYLKDPLWYAAKWGGFIDRNGNGIPDQRDEWATKAAATGFTAKTVTTKPLASGGVTNITIRL